MKTTDYYLKEQTTDSLYCISTHSHHTVDENLIKVVCERLYILMHVSRKIKNKSLHTENNLQEVLFFLEYEDLVKFGAKRQKTYYRCAMKSCHEVKWNKNVNR